MPVPDILRRPFHQLFQECRRVVEPALLMNLEKEHLLVRNHPFGIRKPSFGDGSDGPRDVCRLIGQEPNLRRIGADVWHFKKSFWRWRWERSGRQWLALW